MERILNENKRGIGMGRPRGRKGIKTKKEYEEYLNTVLKHEDLEYLCIKRQHGSHLSKLALRSRTDVGKIFRQYDPVAFETAWQDWAIPEPEQRPIVEKKVTIKAWKRKCDRCGQVKCMC